MELGRYLAASKALYSTSELDLTLKAEDGYYWLGSVLTALTGTERTHLYVTPETTMKALQRISLAVERACTPLPDEKIVEGLSRLMLESKLRALNEAETELAIVSFHERLAEYPADAVSFALRNWPEHNVFFPSWAELRRMVEAHCWQRIRARQNLQRAIEARENGSKT